MNGGGPRRHVIQGSCLGGHFETETRNPCPSGPAGQTQSDSGWTPIGWRLGVQQLWRSMNARTRGRIRSRQARPEKTP